MTKISDFDCKKLEMLAKESGKSMVEMAESLFYEWIERARKAREKGEIPKDLMNSDFMLGHLLWLKDKGEDKGGLTQSEFDKEIAELRKSPDDTIWSEYIRKP